MSCMPTGPCPVSGYHMAVVAGIVFFVVRAILALIPGLADRAPIKKWAALAALIVTAFYLVLSGAEVATQRSFIMIAIVLIGVMLMLVAVIWAGLTPVPDILVGADGRTFAVRGADGRLAFHHTGGDTFATREWLAADADGRDVRDPSLGNGIACDPSGCIGKLADGRLVSHALAADALEEDCERAVLIVTARHAARLRRHGGRSRSVAHPRCFDAPPQWLRLRGGGGTAAELRPPLGPGAIAATFSAGEPGFRCGHRARGSAAAAT